MTFRLSMLVAKINSESYIACYPRRLHGRVFVQGEKIVGYLGRLWQWAGLFVLITVASLTVGFGVPASASALSAPNAIAAPGVFPVNPGPNGYFEYTLFPGSSTTGTIMVHDLTSQSAKYRLYVTAADTSPIGGVSYGQKQITTNGTAAWVHLSASSIQVPEQGAVGVNFTVTLPPSTAPGDYVAALAAQTPPLANVSNLASNASKTGITLITTTRVIVALVVHVPGSAAAAAQFGQPDIGIQDNRRQVITIPIYDTGSLLMKPYLSGDLRSCSGGPVVASLIRQLDTFVPRTNIDYPWYLNNQTLSAGCYLFNLTISTNGTQLDAFTGKIQVGSATANFKRPPEQSTLISSKSILRWLIPAAAGLAFLLGVIEVLLRRARNKRRRLLKHLAVKTRRSRWA